MTPRIIVRKAAIRCYVYKIHTKTLEVRGKVCYESQEAAFDMARSKARMLGYKGLPEFYKSR